ncbi:MAG: ORF6N domain-containing protein [Chitinispirillia bacterium]|nr:ORF6N domain-containing protein [Chitinispirillia bacterium]
MSNILKNDDIENIIVTIRDERVILDSDVAAAYDVETREINQAVKNNADKFPDGYVITLDSNELESLRSKNLILKSGRGQHTKYLPKAFTEKGLYMLATVLKSPKATETTIAIVETFAKIRKLAHTIGELSKKPEKEKQNSLMQKSGEIIADVLGDGLDISDTETDIEINFAVVKFKHKVRRKNNKN